jgi:multidrug efflux system membrane fusion protein
LRQTDYSVKVEQARSVIAQAKAAIEQARHALQSATAGRDKARQDFERASILFQKQSLTKADFDAAKAAHDAAQATMDSGRAQVTVVEARIPGAEAQLEEAQLALADATLRAPVDGVVLRRTIEVGSLVGPGAPAFSIMDVRTVKVIFGAPDSIMGILRIGQQLPVTSEAVPGGDFSGRITRISSAADPRSRVFEVELSVPNPGGRLKPGMVAALEVQRGRNPGAAPEPVVPLTAILRAPDRKDLYAVFVVEDSRGTATARSRSVRLGEALGNRIAVLEGLRAGDRVVTHGATLIRDGQPVQVIP